MIAELSGVLLPKLAMPDAMALGTAMFLTALAGATRRPPAWNMSLDQIKTMKAAPIADGGKASRELGISYTPIRQALREVIESYRLNHHQVESV
jgi:dihydroflavonol-4-reductase